MKNNETVIEHGYQYVPADGDETAFLLHRVSILVGARSIRKRYEASREDLQRVGYGLARSEAVPGVYWVRPLPEARSGE